MPISYKNKIYMGRNIEWNQLLDKSKFATSTTHKGITFINDGNGNITVNGTSTASDYSQYELFGNLSISITTIANHKYFFSLHNYSTDPGFRWIIGGTGNPVFDYFEISGKGLISTSLGSKTGTCYMILRVNKGVTVNNKIARPQLFDLTQMFGAGNEPATPEEFWTYFDNRSYPYNAGETQPLFKISRKRKLYMGRTIEWNQLFNKEQFPNEQTLRGVTFTPNSMDGTITVNGTMYNADDVHFNFNTVSLVIGHKYLFGTGLVYTGVYKLQLADLNAGVDYQAWLDTIFECAGGSSFVSYIDIYTKNTISNLIFKPQLFDLTQMFGAGNEPATPAEFWSYFDHKLYPYNAGETQPLFKISRKSQWGNV